MDPMKAGADDITDLAGTGYDALEGAPAALSGTKPCSPGSAPSIAAWCGC
jgi:hypothetical protein